MRWSLKVLSFILTSCSIVLYILIYHIGSMETDLRSSDVAVSTSFVGTTTKSSVLKLNYSYRPVGMPGEVARPNQLIVIVIVACGDRANETLVVIKSAIIFSESDLRFIVFTEESLMPYFKEQVRSIKSGSFVHKLDFSILPLNFPVDNPGEWMKLFKPCAAQRLFLPDILTSVDSVLYVDTDVLFLSPLEGIWKHFYRMNSSQIAALTPEHEDKATGWYNRFARHPYYGTLGVNSGVMLMNLTRMREFRWKEYVLPVMQKYRNQITWGDQDIINIIFSIYPGKLYIYPCQYNYRPDHCMYTSVCKSAEKSGVIVLHGSRASFHNDKQPAFKAVYDAINEFSLDGDLEYDLLVPMQKKLERANQSNCQKISRIFTMQLEEVVRLRNAGLR